MAIKKYLGKKALKLGKRLFSKKVRSTAQKRALAKAIKISAMKRSKNKIAKTAVFSGFFKPTKAITKTSLKIGKVVKVKGAKKVSKAAANKYLKSAAVKQALAPSVVQVSRGQRIRAYLSVAAFSVGSAASLTNKKLKNDINNNAAVDYMNKQYVEKLKRSFNKSLNKKNPPQLSPELELNAQRQKIQNETEKYLRDMRRKLEQEKRNAKNSIIQNRKTGTI
jgi:hypothetical protein